jgi:oligopeptide transport system substrate-binding protein
MSPKAVAIAVLLACAGCSVGDDGEPYLGTTKRVGKSDDTFYVNNGSEPEYLDPGKIADSQSGVLATQLFEGLTKFHPKDGHLVQGVATHWEVSEDNRNFRFHLRSDARWSDGKPVTAEDFAYAWRRVLKPETASRAATSLYPVLNGELYNRGRLVIAARDIDAASEPGGADASAHITKGTVLRVLGRSPLVVATDVAPFAEQPKTKLVSRKKADAKNKKPEQISFGPGIPAAIADLSASWKDKEVQVLAAGAAVDCDGTPDRFYKVRLGQRIGWLPGCATKPAKGEGFALVAKHELMPTFKVAALPVSAAESEGAPLGFVPSSAVVKDESVLGVRAVDAQTLEVELERPTPYFLELTAHSTLYPVRRDVIEAFEKQGKGDLWTRPESIVNNGAYTLDTWKFRYEMTMKPNPYYRNRDRLKIKRIVWVEVEEYRATLSLYKTGELDYIGDSIAIPPEYMPIAEKKKDFRRADHLSVYWYELNTRRPPLDDPRVRKALDLAIDKRQLIDKVTRSGQTPATHYVPDFTGDGYAERAAADKAAGADPFVGTDHEFDPVRARALLKEAGFEVTADGAGFAVQGMPSIDVLYNTSEGHKAIAVAIQSMWKQNLGVSATLRNEEWSVMQKDYRDGNFHVMRSGWVADYNHPNTFLEPFLSSNVQNQTGWASSEFDEALGKAAREPDSKKSIALYREAEKIAVDARPRIPMYFYTKSLLIKPWVKGFWPSPFNSHAIEWLWIDRDWEGGAPNEPSYLPEEFPTPGRIEASR